MKIKPVKQWRKCSLNNRKNRLPSSSGLYAVLDGSRIMYVGKSKNLNRRWSSGHHRYPQAKKIGARLAWISIKEENITEVENALIKSLHPPCNNTKIPTPPESFSKKFNRIKGWLQFGAVLLIAGYALGLFSNIENRNPTYIDPSNIQQLK